MVELRGSQRRVFKQASRAELKKQMHARYHSQLHNFFNGRKLHLSRASGQSGGSSKNGFNVVEPPTEWMGTPPKVVRAKAPPYTRQERREMRNGVYKW